MISVENSIKKALLNDITSNKKKKVSCEINGWLETCQKKKSDNKIYFRQPQRARNVLQTLENTNSFLTLQAVNFNEDNQFQKDHDKLHRKSVSHKNYQIYLNKSKVDVARYQLQDKQNQDCKNKNESSVVLKKVNMKISDNQSLKSKGKDNKKGYVLKQLRRKLKQKNHLRQYSLGRFQNESSCEKISDMNAKQSFQFLQKRYKMIVINTSRNHQARILQ